MGQQGQDDVQAALSAHRATGKVDDEGVASDAADAAAEGSKGRLLDAAKANLFGDAGNEAITDRERGFGNRVALRQTGAACLLVPGQQIERRFAVPRSAGLDRPRQSSNQRLAHRLQTAAEQAMGRKDQFEFRQRSDHWP